MNDPHHRPKNTSKEQYTAVYCSFFRKGSMYYVFRSQGFLSR